MMKFFEYIMRFQATAFTLLLGCLAYCIFLYYQTDPFETMVVWFEELDHLEIDELFLIFICVIVGFSIDLRQHKKQSSEALLIEQERLRAMRVTMSTVHDIVNNFLNTLNLYRLDLEEKKIVSVDDETVREIDEMINELSGKLKALGNLTKYREVKITDGIVNIDYQQNQDQTEDDVLSGKDNI